jgi:hypothetical protein
MSTSRSPTAVVQHLFTLIRAGRWPAAVSFIAPETVATWRNLELAVIADLLSFQRTSGSSLQAIPQDPAVVGRLLSDYGAVSFEAAPDVRSVAQLAALPPGRLLQVYWELAGRSGLALEWAQTEIIGEFVDESHARVVCQWPAKPAVRTNSPEPIDILLRRHGAEWLVLLEWELTTPPLWSLVSRLMPGPAGAA